MPSARRSFKADGPAQLSAVQGWIRLAQSSQSGGEWTPSIVDVLNPGSPIVQTDTDRRAAVGTSANGLPTMVYDGSDVHLWPQAPALNSVTKLGIWLWFKPASLPLNQALYAAVTGIAGCTATRFALYTHNTNFILETYITNTTGRSFSTAAATVTVGAWHSAYFQYDSSRGGDANAALYVNKVSLALTPSAIGGAGAAALTVLPGATGSVVVGGFTDSDTPTSGMANGGEMGPNIFTFNDNLTAAQIDFFHLFEQPT